MKKNRWLAIGSIFFISTGVILFIIELANNNISFGGICFFVAWFLLTQVDLKELKRYKEIDIKKVK
jgi:hypothetical protein